MRAFTYTMVAGTIVIGLAVYALVTLFPVKFPGDGPHPENYPEGHEYWR